MLFTNEFGKSTSDILDDAIPYHTTFSVHKVKGLTSLKFKYLSGKALRNATLTLPVVKSLVLRIVVRLS